MAGPKPSVVILILVLVALVALFVVGVGLGTGFRPPPSREERLSTRDRLLGPPRALREEEIEPLGCEGTPKHPLVRRNGTCQLVIRRGRTLLRSLKVRTSDGIHVLYTPAGKSKTPIDVELRPDGENQVDLSVQRDGAVLALTCRTPVTSPQICVVAIE